MISNRSLVFRDLTNRIASSEILDENDMVIPQYIHIIICTVIIPSSHPARVRLWKSSKDKRQDVRGLFDYAYTALLQIYLHLRILPSGASSGIRI